MTDLLKKHEQSLSIITTSVLKATIRTKKTATKIKKTTILTKKIITTYKKNKSKLINLCHICQNEFSSVNDLRKHLRVHTGEKPFRCVECDKCFRQSGTLKNHTASQHGTTVQFICAHCNKSFPIKERLRLHMRIHSGEKPYQCDYCRKSFARGGQLKQHLITHYPLNNGLTTTIKKSPSSLSSSASSSSSSLLGKEHLQNNLTTSINNNNNNNDIIDRNQYFCTICKKHFSREILFKKHLKLKHSGGGSGNGAPNGVDSIEKSFRCDVCEKTVKGHLAQHMQTHQKDKLISCGDCGATFSQRCQLIVHQRIHTGERPYRCEICWKAFAYSYVLKLHIRKHTGEKPFNCPVCIEAGVAFAQLSHLKTHMRAIHNLDKTYMCHGCKEFFKIKNELQCHMLTCIDYKTQNQDDVKNNNIKYANNGEHNISTYRCLPNDGQMMTRSTANGLALSSVGNADANASAPTTGMTITKMRMLIAMLLKKILTTERLHKLGYEKRLIDNVLIDSLKIAGQKYCEPAKTHPNLNEFECLKCNVEIFLKWTVPSEYMKKYCSTKQNDNGHTIEQLLENLATRFKCENE